MAYSRLRSLCIGNIIISFAGLIPGYWASFFVIDSWGRKPIQLMGFAALTLFLLILGIGYETLSTQNPHGVSSAQKGLFAVYCLANFFQNFGPNVTTFVIPSETFPTRYRSTAYGIAAASGKFGAIIAQLVFYVLLPTQNDAQAQSESRRPRWA